MQDCDDIFLPAPLSITLPDVKKEECKVTLMPEKGGSRKAKIEKTIPDELKEPNPNEFQNPPPSTFLLPKPIRVYSQWVKVECDEEGTSGDTIEMQEGEFSAVFYFSLVLSLTEEVLDYIARNQLEEWIEKEIHARTLTAKKLRSRTGMTLKQGQELLDAAYALQDKQDEYAFGAAHYQLVCLFWNTSQTAICQDPFAAQTGEAEGAISSFTADAHTFSSSLSQEDADSKARAYAETQLNCFYLNDEVDVDCLTWPSRPVDYSEPVPNDEVEIYPGRGLRVGHVTIPGGQYSSRESKELANELTLQMAYSMLRCWFPNNPVEVACGDPEARNSGVNPKYEEPREANPETGEKGQHVLIPEGYITSPISREDATKEAQMLADSLLECCYVNDAITVRCEPQEIHLDDGTSLLVEPDPDSSILEFTIPEGTYTSCYSKEDANEIAQQATVGMLDCRYCNGMIPPTCVPSWIIEGVNAGTITLPLQSIISDGVHSVHADKLPPEATIGVPEKAYCTNDAQLAHDIADSTAHIPIGGDENGCIYLSDAVYVTCSGSDPRGGGDADPGVVHYRTDSGGNGYIFYTMYPSGACLADDVSRPKRGKYIYNPPGLFTSVGSNAEANRKSLELAQAQLFCVWENVLTRGACGEGEGGASFCDAFWLAGKAGSRLERLTPWSNSPDNPIIFPRGYIRYVGNGGDEEFALNTIYTYIQRFVSSMVVCVYENQEAYAECPDVGMQKLDECGSYRIVNNGTSGIIQAGIIFTDSPEESDTIAKALAEGIAACDEDTITDFGYTFPDIPEPPTIPQPGGGGDIVLPSPSSKPKPNPEEIPVPTAIGPGPTQCFWDCPYYRRGYKPQCHEPYLEGVNTYGEDSGKGDWWETMKKVRVAMEEVNSSVSSATQEIVQLRMRLRELEKKAQQLL